MPPIALAVLIWLSIMPPASAETALLIHGYLGDGNSWKSSGIENTLTRSGWVNGGRLDASTSPSRLGPDNSHPVFFTLDLPSTAPLTHQADVLWARVNQLDDYRPGEPVVLVGHSAGGVVARLALVRFGPGPVTTLITIASPHLGTPRALQGLDVIQDSGPFEFIKKLVGGNEYRQVKRSGVTLWDLAPPRPGNLLYWLNTKEHPALRYVSVIRVPGPNGSDEIVPTFSQDLNQVQSLRGRSEVIPTWGEHYLDASDGHLIHRVLIAPPSAATGKAAPH